MTCERMENLFPALQTSEIVQILKFTFIITFTCDLEQMKRNKQLMNARSRFQSRAQSVNPLKALLEPPLRSPLVHEARRMSIIDRKTFD